MKKTFLVLPLLFLSLMVAVQTPNRPAGLQASQPRPQNQSQTGQSQSNDQTGGQQPSEINEEMRANAEEGIKHTLVDQVDAWNRGDLQQYMNGYWHSPEVTFFSGTSVTKGWQATLQRYQQRYQSEGKEMGQLTFQDLKIDLLDRRAAVVTGRWQLTMSGGQHPGGLFTLVVKRMPGGWRIVHDHTSGG